MTDEAPPELEPGADPAPPAFDKTAARARYRALMRSWPMRLMYALTALAIILAWALGIGSVYAPDVDTLPGHDITITAATCKNCHSAGINAAPAFNHAFAPTCGFCHRQGLPEAIPPAGRLR